MQCPADVLDDSAHVVPQASSSLRFRYTRPSLLDASLSSEPGLGPCRCMPNVAVLYLMNRPIAVIQATPMDQASLDSTLARVRSRSPR